MKITNKRQMYQMMARGDFGNHMPFWLRLDQVPHDVDTVGIRSLRPNHPLRFPRIPREELDDLVMSKLRDRFWANDLLFSSTDYGVEEYRTVQGELMRTPKGLYFFHSFYPGYMRVALEKGGRHAYGIKVHRLLDRYVDASGIDHLHALLDEYDGCVVEFTAFRIPVGTLHTPTLIWEVRHYQRGLRKPRSLEADMNQKDRDRPFKLLLAIAIPLFVAYLYFLLYAIHQRVLRKLCNGG